jgi:DNA (cytosine-5)-methyltransferase 1
MPKRNIIDRSSSPEDNPRSRPYPWNEIGLLNGESKVWNTPQNVTPTAGASGSSSTLSDIASGYRRLEELDDERNGTRDTTSGSTLPKSRNIRPIQATGLNIPKSRYAGYQPPSTICAEDAVIQEFHDSAKREIADSDNESEGGFIEFDLSNFVAYLPDNKYRPFEFVGLQDLATRSAHSCFLFDGILSTGNGELQRYVQGVPFQICSIGNYGKSHDEVGGNVWIQSDFNAGTEVYYHLKSPAPEYVPFHDGFRWLANLSKHFVDFCEARVDEGREVSIHDFRLEFAQWLQTVHAKSSAFRSWYEEYESNDFRRAISININFLFKESVGVDENLRRLPIWGQLIDMDYIPCQTMQQQQTIVTPYVYNCFKDLRFGGKLKEITPSTEALDRCAQQGIQLDLRPERPVVEISSFHVPKSTSEVKEQIDQVRRTRRAKINGIKVGDVLSISRDGAGSVWIDEISRWRKEVDEFWYVYVQDIHISQDGERSFTAIWLYKPCHTSCAKMKYPYPNELFFSNHCTCFEGEIDEDRVMDVVDISWHGHPLKSDRGLFVRQTYVDNERYIVLKDTHKKCKHMKRQTNDSAESFLKFPIGQTVLAPSTKSKPLNSLEPCEVVKYIEEDSRTMLVLRRLLRRSTFKGQADCPCNELLYTENTFKVEANKVTRPCLVRFYTELEVLNNSIPTPYDRNGIGNAFFITSRLVEDEGRQQQLVPIYNDLPLSLIEGFDPHESIPREKLRGLDLYCGGGNFGRGLEEGGTVENLYAVDIAKSQIHTYFANLKNPTSTKLFHGSVDDQLYQALMGNPKNSDLIPLPGDIDFISAGSPCQGFSVLNLLKNGHKGLKNQSLVASVAAYVDFFRPKYGVLENVLTMAQKGLGRDEDVLSQLICALVGLGYQLDVFILDAWSYGSPQSRSRLFVSFSAPNCTPLSRPEQSHSHPLKVRELGLGKLNNKQALIQRVRGPTPFNYIPGAAAVSDLPNIGDGRTNHCTPHPDHVVAIRCTHSLRAQISAIPIYPRGSNFASAWNGGNGVMSTAERACFPFQTRFGTDQERISPGSKAWGRINPKSLLPTIIVHQFPQDARVGTILHWDQPRMLTIMEARRAQGFLDHEVLVGTPAERWKIVGNSVARGVSLALGLSLREAWLATPRDVPRRSMSGLGGELRPTTKSRSTDSQRGLSHRPRPRQIISISDSEDELQLPDPISRRHSSHLPHRSLSNGHSQSHSQPHPRSYTPPHASNPRKHPNASQTTSQTTRHQRPQKVARISHSSPSDSFTSTDLSEDEGKDEDERDNPEREQAVMKTRYPGLVKRVQYLGESNGKETAVPVLRHPASATGRNMGLEGVNNSRPDVNRIANGKVNGNRNRTMNGKEATNRNRTNTVVNGTASPQYTPTANNDFMAAYAQTYRTFNYEQFRRHGPKDTW